MSVFALREALAEHELIAIGRCEAVVKNRSCEPRRTARRLHAADPHFEDQGNPFDP
jgi:hypothetical protein